LSIDTRLLPGDYDNFFQTFQGFSFFSIETSWILKLQSWIKFFDLIKMAEIKAKGQ